jgi:hypothetical protein
MGFVQEALLAIRPRQNRGLVKFEYFCTTIPRSPRTVLGVDSVFILVLRVLPTGSLPVVL